MQKLTKFFEEYRRQKIEDPLGFTLANLVIVVFVTFAIIMNLPSSNINYVKKDVLPAQCSGLEGVEVDGKKYYCVDFWWKEAE